MIAQIVNGMSFPAFTFEIIGDFTARPTMIGTMNNIVVARILYVGKCGSDGFLEGHKLVTVSHSASGGAIQNPLSQAFLDTVVHVTKTSRR
jgi:hypothetical protein